MKHLTIKCHKTGTLYMGEHFFILNKGRNSGKPLTEPCANCWVLLFPNRQERENCYWLAYSLWQARFWHYFQVGSVIPFLRLFEFKKEFALKAKSLQADYDLYLKNVLALQLLQKKENQFRKNLDLVRNMRAIILNRYINL